MEETRKEFDRSVCYQHFEEFHEQIMRVKEMYGIEKAFNVYQAIAEYGLYQTEITDKELLILVGESVIRGIDRSQRKRSKSFSKTENMDMTKAVIDYYCDHPEASQNKIALALGISKGKVNTVLKNYKAGKYDNISFSNSDSNSHSISSSYSGLTDDRVDRDRLTDHDVDADAKREEILRVLDLHRQGFSYKRDNPQIQQKTGLGGQRIHYIIEHYKDDEEYQPKEDEKIPKKDGTPSLYSKKDLENCIEGQFLDRYKLFTTDETYEFDADYIKQWFIELGWDGKVTS